MYKMSLAIALLGALAAHILWPHAIYAQSPETEMDKKSVWTKSYCGEKNEFITSIISTPDGGALLGGYTTSNGANESDIYLLRVDADGNMLWDQSYGESGWDVINAMTLTADGGALLGGYTESKGAGSADMYLARVDADGNILWDQRYGESGWEHINSIALTADGGALLGGFTQSKGAGRADMYLIKVDSDGNMLWEQSYGGLEYDQINSITLTPDGGALLGGFTQSTSAGLIDMYLVRVDNDGNMLWEQSYGGSEEEIINSITLTADGGALLGGYTASKGAGSTDMYLVRVDSDGNMLWDQSYGGIGWDEIRSITLTPDGGVLLGGITERSDGDGIDAYLVRVDSDGKMLWDRGYGGNGWNEISSIALTPDGGALLGGGTDNIGSNEYDAYLIKIRSIAP